MLHNVNNCIVAYNVFVVSNDTVERMCLMLLWFYCTMLLWVQFKLWFNKKKIDSSGFGVAIFN